ncbi:hypothetical protein [Pedobacter yonginense]|nr:hypothetical protein [Pedobacter yonginense]
MRKYLIMCSALFIGSACKNKTGTGPGQEKCDCYREAMSYSAKTMQLSRINDCYNWYQTDLERLNLQLTERELSQAQTQKELEKYKKIYKDCNCETVKR